MVISSPAGPTARKGFTESPIRRVGSQGGSLSSGSFSNVISMSRNGIFTTPPLLDSRVAPEAASVQGLSSQKSLSRLRPDLLAPDHRDRPGEVLPWAALPAPGARAAAARRRAI